MHFKNPEILYFLFLLVIPILIHLFQLRKFKTEYFTNVRFLKELSIQTRKSSKLKKYLLLGTRLLLLTFLIFAFAQPFFKSIDNKNASNELYIVLDNSFSMQAKGKNGELLKRAVEDLLAKTPENLSFSLLTCSDNYWNTNIKSIQKELQNLKYSANEFKIDEIVNKLKARKSAFNKDIVIITDAVGLKANQLQKFKTDENLSFLIPKAEKTDNIAIDSVYIKQNLADFYEISVHLSAFGRDFKGIPIALYNKNKLVAKTIINFESKVKIVNFTIPKSDFQGYVTITDSSLDYDNAYYFGISKAKKCNVICIGDPLKSNFLSRIYLSDEFNYQNFSLPTLDYNLIDKQDAIVLNEILDIPIALQTTLKSYFENGGNVILIPNQQATIKDLNLFLANFGRLKIKSKVLSDQLITKINFDHPLFDNVFEKRITNFQYPKVKTFFETTNSVPQILGYNDQTAFLSGIQNSLSSFYIFSASINKENSNFQNSPLIVPVFYNMAQNKLKTGLNSIKIGTYNPIFIETTLEKDAILKIKNNTESFIPLQQISNGKVKLTCNDNPTNAGNFEVFNGNQSLSNLSFNYSRTESDLKNIGNATDDFNKESDIETLFEKLQTNRTDNQIWKWFVVLALLFLILEIFIQKIVK